MELVFVVFVLQSKVHGIIIYSLHRRDILECLESLNHMNVIGTPEILFFRGYMLSHSL